MDDRTKSGILLCLFFAFLIGALFAGMAALNYEFYLQAELSEGESVSDRDVTEWTTYEELPAEDQRIVDRAIDGQRVLFPARIDVPGVQEPTTGNLVVRDGETHYVFQRGLVFVWQSPAGVLSLGLLGGAFLCFAYIFRLQR